MKTTWFENKLNSVLAEAITPVAIQYAKALISGEANPYKDDTPVYYDAMFNGDNPPYFNMIRTKVEGHGLGFLAFLHFLSYVGKGEEFYSSDFTPAGKALFDKAAAKGIIQQTQKPANTTDQLTRHTWWKVTSDPTTIVQQIANANSEKLLEDIFDEGWKDLAKKGVLAATLGATGLGMMPGQAKADDRNLLADYVRQTRAGQTAEKSMQDQAKQAHALRGVKIGNPKLREKFDTSKITRAEWLKYSTYYGRPNKHGFIPNPEEFRSWIPGPEFDGLHVKASTHVDNDVLTDKDIQITPHKKSDPITPTDWQQVAKDLEQKQQQNR